MRQIRLLILVRAGVHGGEIVYQGTVEEIKQVKGSVTADYLSGRKHIPLPLIRRQPNGKWLVIEGAREHNLKNIDVAIPLNVFTCVTGVSGSGKSTLVNEILYKVLAHKLNRARVKAGAHEKVTGLEYLEKVVNIDQSPIGRTPRSNPATYTGTFDLIREVFARTNEPRMRDMLRVGLALMCGERCESMSRRWDY